MSERGLLIIKMKLFDKIEIGESTVVIHSAGKTFVKLAVMAPKSIKIKMPKTKEERGKGSTRRREGYV